MSLGPAEILVVLVIALVVFGPKKLPEVGRQVGGALRELRKVQDTVQSEIRTVFDDTTAPVHRMSSVPDEQSSQEADLGDEHAVRDIDGLSDGGTFS
jgi:TatA/E family protein of Tat protein translocase